jgi:hypothetical protein
MDCINTIDRTPRDYVPSWNGLDNVAASNKPSDYGFQNSQI